MCVRVLKLQCRQNYYAEFRRGLPFCTRGSWNSDIKLKILPSDGFLLPTLHVRSEAFNHDKKIVLSGLRRVRSCPKNPVSSERLCRISTGAPFLHSWILKLRLKTQNLAIRWVLTTDPPRSCKSVQSRKENCFEWFKTCAFVSWNYSVVRTTVQNFDWGSLFALVNPETPI